MNWGRLAARWKDPEPQAPLLAARCTCHPSDVPLGLAAFDCPFHGFEATRRVAPQWPPPAQTWQHGERRAEQVAAALGQVERGMRRLDLLLSFAALGSILADQPVAAVALTVAALAVQRQRLRLERARAAAQFVRDLLKRAAAG